MMRQPRKVGPKGQYASVPIAAPEPELPPAAMDYYWHPDREGVEQAPEDFRRDLRSVDHYDLVRVVRPPAGAPLVFSRAWLLWYKKASVTHELSPGWLMLCEWRDRRGEALPLDNRVFSYLYSVSAQQFGSGKKYWDHCVEEMKRDKASREKFHADGNHDRAEDYRQSTLIKNIGRGNKFARHQDGTIFPSRGQANWNAENRKRSIPGIVAKEEAEAVERIRAARG